MPIAAQRATRTHAAAAVSEFEHDVVAGLMAPNKRIAPKYFYDEEGSRLFERITRLPEYYPTRTEIGILREKAGEIAALFPERTALVEFGSGACIKVRILLDAAPAISHFVPVDISGKFLERQAAELARACPGVSMHPLAADFTMPFRLPRAVERLPKAGFFPGSTIGNFEPHEATAFLRHAGSVLGRDALLIVGVDLVKDERVLHAAYNDAAGVTARFNLNLLRRINRELDGDFDLRAFAHRAFYNRTRSRIEMHLVSTRRQTVHVAGVAVAFSDGETIHTECSYKYTLHSFADLAGSAGWTPQAAWTDPAGLFSLHALRLT